MKIPAASFCRLFFLLTFVTAAAFLLDRGRTDSVSPPEANAKGILQFVSSGHVLGFVSNGIYVAGASHLLRVEFVNSRNVNPVGVTVGSGKPADLSRVSYPDLWNGVTLRYDAPVGAIARSNYRIEPRADVDNVRLRYNAPVSIENNGALRVDFQNGSMTESAPAAWQERNGERFPVRVAFAQCNDREIGFSVGEYDRTLPLFIDPTLTWNTFLGGAGSDEAFGLTVDALGNVYIAGFSTADWGSAVRPYSGGVDAFAAKLDSNGNMIWTAFLGSAGNDEAFGVAVDLIGNVYVTGYSDATWGNPVRAFGSGEFESFTAKLDPNGNLVWNTFLGGDTFQSVIGRSVAVDAVGNVYVAGRSSIGWGSPVNGFSGGSFDAFAAKLDSNGALVWNTFLGASGFDEGFAIAIDAFGSVYVGGDSDASWGNPIRPYAGASDGFLAKLDQNGAVQWNTFLGSSLGDESVQAIALDAVGDVIVSGGSSASWGNPVRAFSSGNDGFAAKLDSSGTFIWNTFLGGDGTDTGQGVTVDQTGNIYVVGYSDATWGSPDQAFNTPFDAYASKLDSSGNLIWNTFLGGASNDFGFATGVDATGNVYAAGYSQGSWGQPLRAYTAAEDGFVAKLSQLATPTPTPSPTPSPTPTSTPSATPTPTPSTTPFPTCEFPTSITDNFNGTRIHSGSYIWFNAVLKPSDLHSRPVTFLFTQQSITSASFTVAVPDAMVIFDPAATSATTTFTNGMWVTRVPVSGFAGNTFFSGAAFQVPADIPGGLKQIKWSGTISTDTPGVSLEWKWAAAVYTMFSADYDLLGVKPVDDKKVSLYKNSDHAGTPENFKTFVIGGATGGGASNYTGGLSGSVKVGPCD